MEEQDNNRLEETGATATAVQTQAEAPDTQQYDNTLAELDRRIKSGGNWFYWIAGLSIVNTLVVLFNGNMAFIVGLGFTQIVDSLIQEYGGLAIAIGLPLNLMIAGVYVMFGYFSCRRARWAFITGMILYSLDAIIFLFAKDVFGIGFHLFALFCIFSGLKADTQARAVEAERMQAQGVS